MRLLRSAVLACTAVLLAGWSGMLAAAAPDRQDVTRMPAAEVSALQQRLADAGCYTGPLDGQATEATWAAVQACPDQRPQLRIETGMHVALVGRIGVDRDCRLAATASWDKTVRLWSLPDGRPLRVLRWPVNPGNGGMVFATAVSPDGHFVVAGGWDARAEERDAQALIVFDAATGEIAHRIEGFSSRIVTLAFSHDGRWLAVGLGGATGNFGVSIISVETWQVIASDAYSRQVFRVAFAPDGRLYTTSYDGKLRRYGPGPTFVKEGEVATQGGKRPFAVDIDPRGTRLAVGFDDSTTVDLYDASSLTYRGHADTVGIDKGDLANVAWRRDGRVFFAGGRYENAGSHLAVVFNRDGQQRGKPVAVSADTITDLKSCGDGFAVSAYDPAFGLLGPDGRKRLWSAGVTADMRKKIGAAFTVSADTRRVRFGLDAGAARPVLFDLAAATLSDAAAPPADLAAARIDGLPVHDWLNTTKPMYADRPLALEFNEYSRSFALRLGGDGFVIGTNYLLRAFDAGGRERWQWSAPGTIWGVNLSADGRIVVAASADGTLRWHRWSDGQELLALFVNKNTRAWVAWTPSGYYSASPGGEDMIGWHLNRGWAQAADFFPASKFHDTFARPDIVERMLDTLDEAEAVRQADAARPRKAAAAAPITERLPPVVSILSPADGAEASDEVRLDYLVRSPSGLPVDAVEALIDGRPASAGRGLGRVGEGGLAQCLTQTRGLGRVEGGGLKGCRGSLTVALPSGAREVGLFARSGERTSEVVRVRLARAAAPGGGMADGADLLKPRLYALVVGISAYGNPDYALAYPAKDARDFASALRNQKGGLYADVEVRSVQDGEATAKAIRQGLDWLTKQVTSRDVGIVYLAGHGMLDERERFYFLASDSESTALRATAVPREDIADALDALPGKALLFLDACHAGAIAGGSGRRGTVDVNAVVNDFARSERGVVVFAASTGKQVSQENAAWNNGAFTKAVVEGLGLPGSRGKADLVGAGSITTSELDAYVANRVKALTEGGQSPVMIRPATVPDFPLAMAR